MSRVEVSLVFPAYNEASRIEYAVEKAIESLKEIPNFEIIIAEDGSTDGTDRIASMLSLKYPFVRHIHNDRRLGRGRALREVAKKAKGEIMVYMDVDLATSMKHLKELIQAIREGYDFATGSRMLPGSRAERKASRAVASRIYNLIIRLMFKTGVSDHQCGFKSFRRKSLLQIVDDVKAEHWFWDTEVLVKASRKGYRIKEIPVEWRERETTKVKLFKDSVNMLLQALRLWLEQVRQ
ncbi:MAG: glycosyltransferase [Thermoproteota archaeon]